MILVTGSVQLKPEARDEALRLGCEHSARSRAEPGCISHICMVDAEGMNRMCFHEVWADMSALQAHFQVQASRDFVKQVASLAVAAPKIEIFEVQSVKATPF